MSPDETLCEGAPWSSPGSKREAGRSRSRPTLTASTKAQAEPAVRKRSATGWRAAVPALCRGAARAAGGAAGHRRGGQGRHHPPRHERAESAGRDGDVVQSAGRRGEAARLSVAGPPGRPGVGQIGIFNRSHYEDVLVVRVHDLVPKSVWSQALRTRSTISSAC